MDLRTERKIKFWLATISKVLVIALVLFKLFDILFDEKDTAAIEKKPIANSIEKEVDKKDTIQKQESVTKLQKTPTTLAPNKQNKDENNTAVAKTEPPTYAKLNLTDNSFIWLKDTRKFVLKLKNTSGNLAKNVTVNAVLVYEKEQQTIVIKQDILINANQELNLDFIAPNVLQTNLPKTILLCITHDNKNTSKKHWYNYILGNKIAGSGAIETRSVLYNVLSVSDGVYTNTPPNCIIKPLTSSKVVKTDNTEIKNIASSVQLFLRGLNNKSQITVKSTTTPKLYTLLTSLDFNTYSYGFSNTIDVVSHTKNTAIVKLVLSEEGRSTYIQQQHKYKTENSSKTVDDFFRFLTRKGNSWEGKLINLNGIWKFDVN